MNGAKYQSFEKAKLLWMWGTVEVGTILLCVLCLFAYFKNFNTFSTLLFLEPEIQYKGLGKQC